MTITNGAPWKLQYQFNESTLGTNPGWAYGTYLPYGTNAGSAIVTKNRVYLVGGTGSGGPRDSIYTAPIDSSGVIGTWVVDSEVLPVQVAGAALVATRDRCYLIGGYNAGGSLTSVYTAPIDDQGVIGPWTTSGYSLPTGIRNAQAVITRNRIYLLGGYTTAATNKIHSALISNTGIISAWSEVGTLPIALHASSIVETNGRVYLLGGYNDVDTLANVYSATYGDDGILSSWTTEASLPGAIDSAQAIVTRNSVWLLCGHMTITYGIGYRINIDANGILDTGNAASVACTYSTTQIVVTSSRLYRLGGYGSSGYTTDQVQYAPFSGGLDDYSIDFGFWTNFKGQTETVAEW